MIARPLVLSGALLVGLSGGLAACSQEEAAPPSAAVRSALAAPVPGVTLPPDDLLPLVPAPDEVPPGMVPVLTGSGPRDVAAIAAYSSDPTAARAALTSHGFVRAYVAQYAEPGTSRVLSVVAVRFRDAAGATADLAGDLAGDRAAGSGEVVQAAPVGEQSQLTRQPLPTGGAGSSGAASGGAGSGGAGPGGNAGQLLTLRFRTGATTWLVAYGDRPEADVSVPVGLGQRLVVREGAV